MGMLRQLGPPGFLGGVASVVDRYNNVQYENRSQPLAFYIFCAALCAFSGFIDYRLRYHQTDKDTPCGRSEAKPNPDSRIASVPRLGGLHHRYDLAA